MKTFLIISFSIFFNHILLFTKDFQVNKQQIIQQFFEYN